MPTHVKTGKASALEMESVLERLETGLIVLQEISVELGKKEGLDEILQKVIDIIVRFLKVKKASIMVLDTDGYLHIRASHGLPEEIARSVKIKLGENISGYVAKTQKSLLIEDVSSDSRFGQKKRTRYESNSLLSVPMLIQKDVLGVININDKMDGSVFDSHDQRLLSVVAGHTAAVVRNYQMYSRLMIMLHRLNRSNKRLSAVRKRLRLIIDHIVDAVIATDSKGKVILFNHSAGSLFPELKSGRSLFTHLPTPAFGKWMRAHFKLTRRDEPISNEYRLEMGSQRKTLFHVTTIPIKPGHHSISGYLTIIKDITFDRSIEDKKREFLALVSHEIRTPITVLKSYISSMLAGFLGDLSADQSEGLRVMQSAVNRLQREVNNMMTMSRIDQEDFEPEQTVFDFSQELAKQKKLFSKDTEENGVQIEFCMPDNLPPVLGDPTLIRTAIGNLIDNAVKFSPPDGIVKVDCKVVERDDDRYLAMSVSDQGPGISPQYLDRIFNRFEQVESHLIRKSGGTGLGLSMVKRIAELNKGWVDVQTAPGKGSCFTLAFRVQDGMEK